jgi:CHASE2 domain-containing sensor protein
MTDLSRLIAIPHPNIVMLAIVATGVLIGLLGLAIVLPLENRLRDRLRSEGEQHRKSCKVHRNCWVKDSNNTKTD